MLLALGAAAVALSGCGKNNAAVKAEAERAAPRTVKTARVVLRASPETVLATGTLSAQDRAVLSVKASGRVESIAVDIGSRVQKGQVLAEIEKTDFELRRAQAAAALAQARARIGLPLAGDNDEVEPENASNVKEARAVLSEAAKNRERIVNLRQQGIIAEAEVETAEANFLVASNRYEGALNEARDRIALLKQRRAELNLAEQQLADTVIRAPFGGVIEQRQTSPGEFLQEGDPVLTLVRVDPIRLRVEVPERDAARLRGGQEIQMQLEGDSETYRGKIERLSPVISAETRMLAAEADLPNGEGRLRPGSFAKAEIVVDEKRQGLFVPNDAIVTFAGIQKVFAVENGKAVEKEITTGRTRDEHTEILKGLKNGETLILNPGSLRSGQPVQIDTSAT